MFGQICPWDTLACCWDVKQPIYNNLSHHARDLLCENLLRVSSGLNKSWHLFFFTTVQHENVRKTKATSHRLQTFFDCCLHIILCIHWPEMITSEDLQRRANQEPLAAEITRRKWNWISHTCRTPASNITGQALTWNLQGKGKRGRPRDTWCRTSTWSRQKCREAVTHERTQRRQPSVNWAGGVLSMVYAPLGQKA